MDSTSMNVEPSTSSTEHICFPCGKRFSRKSVLNHHMKIHSGVKSFACETCDKAFTYKGNLVRHKVIHTEEHAFECVECKLVFKRKDSWKRHMQLHLEEGYPCDECSEIFLKIAKLKQHKRAKHTRVEPYVCSECDEAFSYKVDLNRHKVIHKKEYECNKCNITFRHKYNLTRHMLSHVDGGVHCDQCDSVFSRRKEMLHHKKLKHQNVKQTKEKIEAKPVKCFEKKQSALGIFSVYELIPSKEASYDLIKFFEEVRPLIAERIEAELYEHRCVKWYVVCNITMLRTVNGFDEMITPHFRSNCIVELREDTIAQHIDEVFAKISESFEEFNERGSGWILGKIHSADINCAKYRAFR